MYKNLRVAIVIPAYNEEKLITKTITTIPAFVDHIIVINDCSTDKTLSVLRNLQTSTKKLTVHSNDVNQGVGASVVHGFREALKSKADIVGVMAGDAQCDPSYLSNMLDTLIDEKLDYVKANRFFHRTALQQMPKYRQIGNIFITILNKFSTGYYSIFDSQNGYGVFTRKTLEKLQLDMIGKRYDYENTLLIGLSIIGARVKDEPVPAIYGDEVSTIKFLPTAMRALKVLFAGFWKRIYYKYIIYGFHPIALFLFGGLLLNTIGMIGGVYLLYLRIFKDISPSSGTVMLIVLPLVLGFQLLLSAVTMDMNNEGKS